MRHKRVHGGPTIRAHGRSECEIAHSNRCCVRSRYLSFLPEASWARHVPFPVREALNERFVMLLYHCHVPGWIRSLGRFETQVALYVGIIESFMVGIASRCIPLSGDLRNTQKPVFWVKSIFRSTTCQIRQPRPSKVRGRLREINLRSCDDHM